MNEIKFYNTYSKSIETFKPIKPGIVTIYTCGPTVYSHPSIGNFKTFLTADILKRFLKFKGFQVKHIINITDVGHLLNDADEGADKLEEEAKKQKKNPLEIAAFYTNSFLEAWKLLKMDEPDRRPKATEHIKEMISMVEILIKKGLAYVVGNNVYYDVTKFNGYGKLSGNTLEDLNAGARIEINDEKKNPEDFALWKHDPKHIQQWESPWGSGFPGWHIECSAMCTKYLGEQIDIHTGGEDLIFPHHECEIAQAEGATGKKYVNYWIHSRFLMVDGEKMSKSKGNLYTVQELVEKGYSARAIRYTLISAHYRQNYNFTFESLKGNQEALAKLDQFAFILDETIKNNNSENIRDDLKKLNEKFISDFDEALSNDLNVSKAFGHLFDFMRDINKLQNLSKKEASATKETLLKVDSVFTILKSEEEEIPDEIKKLAEERINAKKNKDFQKADLLRKQILDKNFIVEDIPGGYRIKKK